MIAAYIAKLLSEAVKFNHYGSSDAGLLVCTGVWGLLSFSMPSLSPQGDKKRPLTARVHMWAGKSSIHAACVRQGTALAHVERPC